MTFVSVLDLKPELWRSALAVPASSVRDRICCSRIHMSACMRCLHVDLFTVSLILSESCSALRVISLHQPIKASKYEM